jgi:hypothetical protein
MPSGDGSADFLALIFHPSSNGQNPLNPGIERVAWPFQYIRETALENLSQREILSADLAPHLVGLGLEVDLLALGETRKTSPLDRADMNEHIVAAVVGLNESEALLAVEPLHSTCRHFFFSKEHICAFRVTLTQNRFNSSMSMEKEPAGAFNKAQRLNEQP